MLRKILLLTIAFLGMLILVPAQSITRFEYFFDTDPGVGNGVAYNPGATADSVTVNLPLDISGLSAGHHKAGIRSVNTSGIWSHTEFRNLFITATVTNSNTAIAEFEYFLDADPGQGNGISVSVTSADSVTASMLIDITGVPAGLHKLGIRSMNSSGKWSHTDFHDLYITVPPDHSNQEIVSGEFYFGNSDPGHGNGTVISISNPADSITVLRDSVLNNLPLGQYKVNVRFKDARGKWSHQETRVLTVCSTYGPQSEMSYQTEGNRVYFTNQSLYHDTVTWKFGDNTLDTVTHPIKTYINAGVYNLQLITGNTCGIDTLAESLEIKGLQRINAVRAGNAGIATVTFTGFGFSSSTNIKLVKDGIVTNPLQKFYQSSESILGYFDLDGKPTGLYHAVADLGSAFDTLYNAFTIDSAISPSVTVSIGNGRRARPRNFSRIVYIQNTGNQDAILVPVTSEIGFVEGNAILDPAFFTYADMVYLNNKGIFQHTYNYLAANGISTDVMLETDTDTTRKKKLVSYMRLKVPAHSRTADQIKAVTQTSTPITFSHGIMVHPPYFESDIITGNTVSLMKDCVNSFLKKAIKQNIAANINDSIWTTCFNEAYDTLAGTIREIVNNPLLHQQSIPSKAFFSALLAQMADCTASGMPAILSNTQFSNIIKDMTYNWFFYENIDSLGQPCVDSVLTVSRNTLIQSSSASETGRPDEVNTDDCPGAIFAPELAEECAVFTKPCKQLDEVENADNYFFLALGRKLFEKLTSPFSNFCKVNSASVFCEQLCQSNSVDPNIKEGPGNNDDLKYVNHLQAVSFNIRFENMDTATSPAAYVEIRDTIDINMFDMQSFQAGSFGWDDTIIYVEANRKDISMLIDLRPNQPNKLRVDITADTASGIAVWKFWTVDTTTLQLTTDPSQGFLPPNINGQEGVGYVSFTIKPKTGATSGTVLQNQASIIFDDNNALNTTVWEYRIDTTKPVSQVATLPAIQSTAQFQVNWSGSDQHAGIRYYSVYVSVNDSIFKPWISLTSATSDTFSGMHGNTYKFYSIALDKAGNFEDPPFDPYNNPDAVTIIVINSPLPLTLLNFTARKSSDQTKADLAWITANEQGVSHFELQRSADGLNYIPLVRIAANNNPGDSRYTWQDVTPLPDHNYYRLKMVDRDASYSFSPVRYLKFSAKEEIIVFPAVTSDYLYVQSAHQQQAFLIDISGVKLASGIIRGTLLFDLSRYSAGIYFISIPEAGKTFKVIKQ